MKVENEWHWKWPYAMWSIIDRTRVASGIAGILFSVRAKDSDVHYYVLELTDVHYYVLELTDAAHGIVIDRRLLGPFSESLTAYNFPDESVREEIDNAMDNVAFTIKSQNP